MQDLLKSLYDFIRAGVTSNDFKMVLCSFINDMEPQLSNEDCTIGSYDDLPLETLFCDGIIKGPTKLGRLLRDYLVMKVFNYCQHPDTHMPMFGIAK